MVAQFVDDLIHLERRRQGLDQHRGLDRPVGDAEPLLRQHEDVVPEPRLEVALHLRQVEVGARALRQGRLGVVEEIEAEIDQRAGHRRAVDHHVALRQVPAARPDHQHRPLFVQLVGLAADGIDVAELAGPEVEQIDLAVDHVSPGRRVGVLEVGHEHLRPAVQGVDDHLAIGRAGDLDAAIEQVGRDRRHAPIAVAHGLGLSEEVGALAGVEALLARRPRRQQLQPPRVELAMQLGEESQRLGRQQLGGAAFDGLGDLS